MKKLAAALLLSATAATCLASGADGFYYGPFPRDVPVVPLSEFAAGKLGILDTTFQRAYRVAAWRVLNDQPLTSAQVSQLMGAFAKKTDWDWGGNASVEWLDARKAYSPRAVSTVTWGSRELTTELGNGRRQTVYYDNCTSQSASAAAQTLQARVKAYGPPASNKWVAAWLEGQDQVFSACVDSLAKAQAAELPPVAPAEAPAWFKFDRAYQRAAMHFYAGRFEQAREAFDAIAQDKASPWAELAPYLAGRAMLRQGSVTEGALRTRSLQAAADRFSQLSTTGPLRHRKDARALWRRAQQELAPAAELARLGRKVGDEPWTEEATQDLEDLIVLLRKAANSSPGELQVADGSFADWAIQFGFAPVVLPAGQDDFFEDRGHDEQDPRAASAHACEWAQRDTHRKAWTVLCYMKALKEADVPASVARYAGSLASGDSAYATLAYHRARLRAKALLDPAERAPRAPVDARAVAELRNTLNAELARGEAVYGVDGLNAMRVLRSLVSTSPNDFLQQARVRNLGEGARFGWQQNVGREVRSAGLEKYVSADDIYPSLPLSRMAVLARDNTLPQGWASAFAGVAMVRAAHLGQLDLARDLARLVKARQPAAGSELDEFINASEDATRNYILARFLGALEAHVAPSRTPKAFPWLSDAELQQAVAERDRLVVAMQDYFARSVLDYARLVPTDKRLAVNLSEVVKGNKGELSRQAFVLLHKLFPRSEAAKRTRYWY